MISEALVQQFRTKGYAITPKLLDDESLAMVRDVFARIAADNRPGDGTPVVRNNLFPSRLHLKYPEMARFLRHPAFIGLCRQLIGPDADQTWNQAIIKPPRTGGRFGWHQDAAYEISKPLDEGFTLWIAIADTTVDNGTLWVAPSYWSRGLMPHIWDDKVQEFQCQFDGAPEPTEKQPVELKAGQMLIFSRLIPHASGANQTDKPRLAYQVGFGPTHIIDSKGQPFGDRVPVLRDGNVIDA